MDYKLTKISKNGQVVIPYVIRNEMDIAPGTVFMVSRRGDDIVMKRLDIKKN